MTKNIGKNSHNRDGSSAETCEICGSAERLSEYALFPDEDEYTLLCPTHYKVATVLSGETPHGVEYDLQETSKITVRVPKALIEATDGAAEQQGQTRSEFVRDSLERSIAMQDMDEALDELFSRAIQQTETTAQAETRQSGEDVEFLKERIRTLESLLEDSIQKI